MLFEPSAGLWPSYVVMTSRRYFIFISRVAYKTFEKALQLSLEDPRFGIAKTREMFEEPFKGSIGSGANRKAMWVMRTSKDLEHILSRFSCVNILFSLEFTRSLLLLLLYMSLFLFFKGILFIFLFFFHFHVFVFRYGSVFEPAVDLMFRTSKLTSKHKFLDIGCGIGSIVLQAAAWAGCQAAVSSCIKFVTRVTWSPQFWNKVVCVF